MTTTSRKRKNQPSSRPPGWHPAGHTVPFQPTVAQARYCRRAIGISRFVYNLCVATHRFCRTNRLPWPSWQDLNKEINAIKRTDFPFITTVHHRVAEGAVRDFGLAIKNWRDPNHPAGPPRFHRKRLTGSGSFRAAAGISLNQVQPQTPHPTPRTGLPQARPHPPKGPLPRSTHLPPEQDSGF